jgi:uncharacterized membrane protein YhaH (DUF805 family)
MNFDWKQFYFSPDGLVNRKQWWLRLIIPVIAISVVLTVIDMVIGTFNRERGIGLLEGIFSLAVIYPSIIVYIKRWHDRDKSGWWTLILLIPVVGAIWFVIAQGFLAGTPGPNRFGPPVTD